jgi:hypothetical protein
MAANTETTSPGASAPETGDLRPVSGSGGGAVHACQPRIHAAIPRAANSPAPNPARPAPSDKAAARNVS